MSAHISIRKCFILKLLSSIFFLYLSFALMVWIFYIYYLLNQYWNTIACALITSYFTTSFSSHLAMTAKAAKSRCYLLLTPRLYCIPSHASCLHIHGAMGALKQIIKFMVEQQKWVRYRAQQRWWGKNTHTHTPPTLSWTKVTPPALQFNIQLRVQTHFKRLFHQRVIVNRVNLFIPFTLRQLLLPLLLFAAHTHRHTHFTTSRLPFQLSHTVYLQILCIRCS